MPKMQDVYTNDPGGVEGYVCWRRRDHEGARDQYTATYAEALEIAERLKAQDYQYIWLCQWGEYQLPWWPDEKWRKGWIWRWWSTRVTETREYPADVCNGPPPGAEAGVPDEMKSEAVFRPAKRV